MTASLPVDCAGTRRAGTSPTIRGAWSALRRLDRHRSRGRGEDHRDEGELNASQRCTTTGVPRFGTRFLARVQRASAGPPPWDVYEITPTTFYAVATQSRTTPRAGGREPRDPSGPIGLISSTTLVAAEYDRVARGELICLDPEPIGTSRVATLGEEPVVPADDHVRRHVRPLLERHGSRPVASDWPRSRDFASAARAGRHRGRRGRLALRKRPAVCFHISSSVSPGRGIMVPRGSGDRPWQGRRRWAG